MPLDELVAGTSITTQVVKLIKQEHPGFTTDKFISRDALSHYRKKYLEGLIKTEHKDLSKLDKEVHKAIENNQLLSENIEPEMASELTVGQKLADKIASFGGSWTFIIIFFSFLFVWMIVNIWLLATKPFDPYPFILLNLILSCLAAIQAPIIMMSQNRKEQKDRSRSEHDYQVNLKAELEIRLLHEKLDHLMIHQNQRLLDIQELQLDYLEDLVKKYGTPKK
ncbi:Uncharacterized membrane protein [Pricia antarctica]|uniref:Uncharacterized membrane protein n=2 Tax=Pricia antarctica TaxID=641691 RepID=A0A1G7HQC9_9FLAO|nr:Uncharacterized membrane protein [Pricia antarctica]